MVANNDTTVALQYAKNNSNVIVTNTVVYVRNAVTLPVISLFHTYALNTGFELYDLYNLGLPFHTFGFEFIQPYGIQ